MTDQPSSTGDSTEPPRPRTIPDDFIWDEETQSWYAPGEPSTWDAAEWQRQFDELLKTLPPGPCLISRDELLAAGCFKGSSKRRKALREKPVKRDLFSGLVGDEDLQADPADEDQAESE